MNPEDSTVSDATYWIMGKPYRGARHDHVLRNGYTTREQAEQAMASLIATGDFETYSWVKQIAPQLTHSHVEMAIA